MDILLIVLSFILLIGGIVGCFLPVLPGPPLAYVGLLLMHFSQRVEFSNVFLLVALIVVVILQVLDYITPILGNKYSGGSSVGNKGCIVGTILGLFFMPWGIILGPFLGTIIGELLGGNSWYNAIRTGFGALIGFVLGTILKVVACIYFLIQGIVACLGY